jgi:hypothetical protein
VSAGKELTDDAQDKEFGKPSITMLNIWDRTLKTWLFFCYLS